MDFFGFTLSVWSAIAFGIFFLFMVFACTADRQDHENFKWFGFWVGLLAIGVWQWRVEGLNWGFLASASFWKTVGVYAACGLVYSMIEFTFQVRRAARYWAAAWIDFKERLEREAQVSGVKPQPSRGLAIPGLRGDSVQPKSESLERRFMEQAEHGSYGYRNRKRLIGVKINEHGAIVPEVNRKELAESIGCWALFWPAYAVSLFLGDLLTEIFRKLADLVAVLSTGLVRRAFAKVFTT